MSMADSQSESLITLSLPEDIWYLICHHLDHAELKHLRCVSRHINRACIPRLYEVIYLRPTRKSLEYARCVAERPDLARCVTKLILQEDQVSIVHPYYKFERQIRAIWGPKTSKDHISNRIIQAEKTHLKNVRISFSDSWNPTDCGQDTLSCLVKSFPSLRYLSSRQSRCMENLLEYREAHDILRRVYWPEWDMSAGRRKFGPDRILNSLSFSNIRSLELSPIGMEEFQDLHFLGMGFASELHPFQQLSELRMTLYCVEENNVDRAVHEGILDAVTGVFSTASQIHTLALRLILPRVPIVSQSLLTLTTLISSTIFRHTYSNLRTLSLHNHCFSETSFLAFVMNHIGTITSITLRDIHIIKSDGTENPPSILRLCCTLSECVRLKHFNIGGRLTTAAREAWDVAIIQPTSATPALDIRPETITRGSVARRLKSNVCGKEKFPFQLPLDGTEDDMSGHHEVEGIVARLNDEMTSNEEVQRLWGDESWKWVARN